jgi:alkylation response protein AidB-like acyl-CoA dehydrogenase
MDLLLNEEQSLIQQSVRAFARQLGGPHLRRVSTLPGRFAAREFEEAAAAGWLALLLAPEKDGAGLGLTELCLLAEDLGAALAALPLPAAIGGILALAESENPLPAGLLDNAIAGKALIVPAFTSTGSGEEEPLKVTGTANDTRLSGLRVGVPCVSTAAGFVVHAKIGSDLALLYVPKDATGVALREKIAIDGTVLGDVVLDNLALGDAVVLTRGQPAEELKRKVDIVLNFGTAAELLGVMHAAADKTLDYLRLRVQFGRPIGSFQALQHRAVNDHVQVETVRSLLYEAAKLTQFDDNLAALACAAKAKAAEAAPALIVSSIQMHGAIGFTDEHDIGLLLKRALTLAATHGPAPLQRRRYAALRDSRDGNALPNIRNPDPSGEAFRQEVRAWIERTLPTELRHLPTRPSYEHAMWWHRKLAERGWIAPRWPKAHGGMDAPLQQQIILMEELGRAGAPELSAQAINHVGPIIMALGSEAQKARHLPAMLSGEAVWCQGYSEPGAGSDLASLRTSAVRDGDHLVINGQKIWTTWAHHADWMFALVRTDPAAVKQAGITFVLIDMKTPGLTVRPIRTIANDDELAEVFFDNVRVPIDNVVGGIDNGWRVANALLSHERLQSSNPQKCVGALTRLKKAAALGAASDPAFHDKLVAAEIEVLALAAAYEHAVALTRSGRQLGAETSFLKLAASELAQHLAALTIEACGSDAVLLDGVAVDDGTVHPVVSYLQSRRETIFAGSSEIQRNIIAKRVLNLP